MNTILLLINITMMYSAPLILASLGGVISERSGVVNLALEGVMTIGAFIATLVTYQTENPWLGFLAAGLAGGFLMVFHAVASISLKADQTISGIALNFIGPGVALFLCRMFFDGAIMSPPVKKLPSILSFMDTSNSTILQNLNFNITIIIAFVLVFLMWYFLYKTKWGLRLTSVGEHPSAADSLGINVYAMRYAAVIFSGVLGGFAGASCSLAIVSVFTASVISGKGFIAIAAMIFGKWKPQGALFACLMFGFAQALVVVLKGTKIQISPHILSMLPYVMTLVVLIIFVGQAVSPNALGKYFEKGKR